MGLFPIFMNCLQFWLIDSIVKASAPPSPVSLSPDTPRDSDERDREPLFRASYDDEDDDSATPHDLESQPPRTGSGEPVIRKDPAADEHKSIGSIAGSSVPSTSQAAMHAYPPSLTRSGSAGSSPASSRISSKSPQRRRRSPPPPLLPRSPLQPAINSPSLSQPYHDYKPTEKLSSQLKTEVHIVPDDQGESWDLDWDNNGDDWANRVGEEDWTGRRMGERHDYIASNHAGRQSIDAR
jgi:hypothetical protein